MIFQWGCLLPPKRKREATIHDIPAELFPTIFSLLGDAQSLASVSRVCKMWRRQSEDIRKIYQFSTMLNKAAKRLINYQEVLDYINTYALAVEFSAPNYEFSISNTESIVYIQPSLLHSLAQWVPLEEEEKEVYQSIFNRLLELKANPNAVTHVEAIGVEPGKMKKTPKEESVLETAITMANPYLVNLLLRLYKENKLVVENQAKILGDAIVSYRVWREKTRLDFKPHSRNNILKDGSRDIFLMLIECGNFKPDFNMLYYYGIANPGFQVEIPVSGSSFPKFKSLLQILFEIYPVNKIEEENQKLKLNNQQQQQEIELLKKQLAATLTAQIDLQKEIEELKTALESKEQAEIPRLNL